MLSKILCLFFILPASACYAQISFQKIQSLPSDIYSVSASPLDENLVFAGSGNALFVSRNSGKSFKRIFMPKGEDTTIYFILADKNFIGQVYAASGSGLYVSSDAGRSFKRIFRGGVVESRPGKVLFVAEHKGEIYAGTDNGLYYARQGVYKFKPVPFILKTDRVYWVDFLNDKEFLAAASSGLYKFYNRHKADKVFVSYYAEDGQGGTYPLCVFHNESRVYIGTSSGLFVSDGQCKNIRKVYFSQLEGAKITSIKKYGSSLFVASNKGLFEISLDLKNITPVYSGLDSNDIRSLAITLNKVLFAASGKGLFSAGSSGYEITFSDRIKEIFKHQPSIRETQAAALKYNEVSPDKIKRWRQRLKYRALFPSISLSYDKSVYGTSGGKGYDGKAFVGPRDWSLGFSWDVGDLVWNNYEDDIDTRSRLNTQLRTDILDDVNRLYFERKRLIIEINQKADLSVEEKTEKNLRIEELTAALDGYTGGFFSRRLRELQEDSKVRK